MGHHSNQEHAQAVPVHVRRPVPAKLQVRDYTAKCNLPAPSRRRGLTLLYLSGNLTMARYLRRGMEATVAKSDSKNNLRNYHFIVHVLLPRWHPRTLLVLHRNGSERQEWSKGLLSDGHGKFIEYFGKKYSYLRNVHHRGAGRRRELISAANARQSSQSTRGDRITFISNWALRCRKSTGLRYVSCTVCASIVTESIHCDYAWNITRMPEIYQFQSSYAFAVIAAQRLVSRRPHNVLRQ